MDFEFRVSCQSRLELEKRRGLPQQILIELCEIKASINVY